MFQLTIDIKANFVVEILNDRVVMPVSVDPFAILPVIISGISRYRKL